MSGELFTGEQFDQSLNQYYLRARYYDQSVGRFTQMDSWEGNSQDPITLHKYLYANGNPAFYTDPSGNFGLGDFAVASSIGATLSVSATYVGNYALGKSTSFTDVIQAGITGAVAGPLALAVPAVGVGLGVAGVGSSSWLLAKVFENPDSNYYQKTAAAALVAASMFGTRYAFKYASSGGRTQSVPKFPLQGNVEGIVLESAQPGLRADKIGQLPGMMKSMLEGTGVPAIGGYKSGNRYVIVEGNHRMAAAIQLAKETGNPAYVTKLLQAGRWSPMPASLKTYTMINGE